jgi:DNA-binding ferritin-like protein
MPNSNVSRKRRRHKTRRNSYLAIEQQLVLRFLELLNLVKLFHWKTHSYAAHKASDELYEKLNEHIDTFIEVLLGKIGNRVNLTMVRHLPLHDYPSQSALQNKIMQYKSFLVDLNDDPVLKRMSNSDLFNIRDEILGDLNQFLYLLSFS